MVADRAIRRINGDRWPRSVPDGLAVVRTSSHGGRTWSLNSQSDAIPFTLMQARGALLPYFIIAIIA
jgi:hypothetical protein